MNIDQQHLTSFPTEFQQQLTEVLAYSPYLARQLERHPEWLALLADTHTYTTGELIQTIAAEIVAIDNEAGLMRQVRQIRHRETRCALPSATWPDWLTSLKYSAAE